jgi:hypothetical protein
VSLTGDVIIIGTIGYLVRYYVEVVPASRRRAAENNNERKAKTITDIYDTTSFVLIPSPTNNAINK